MHISTRTGDLSATASMSEEGVWPSEHDHVGTFTPSQNSQEGIKEVKKSAFEITHVQVDNEPEDLENSQMHNKTMCEDDPCSPVSSNVPVASTPSKDSSSSDKDVIQSSSALPVLTSTGTVTSINGPSHLPTAPGSRFRKVNDYTRERWKVIDSLEVDADEHSDISEPRNVPQKMMDAPSNSNSPSTPRRNASLEMASSSNLSDVRSDAPLDEVTRNEGTTLTEAQGSVELSQDDLASTDDNFESYSQGTPSEINVKTDSESASNVEISATVLTSAETIKLEALSIITNMESVINDNVKLKQQLDALKQEVERLKKENMDLRNSGAQETPSSAATS